MATNALTVSAAIDRVRAAVQAYNDALTKPDPTAPNQPTRLEADMIAKIQELQRVLRGETVFPERVVPVLDETTKQEITRLSSEVDGLRARIKTDSMTIKTLETELAKEKALSQQQRDELQDTVDSLKEEIRQAEGDVARDLGRIRRLRESVVILEDEEPARPKLPEVPALPTRPLVPAGPGKFGLRGTTDMYRFIASAKPAYIAKVLDNRGGMMAAPLFKRGDNFILIATGMRGRIVESLGNRVMGLSYTVQMDGDRSISPDAVAQNDILTIDEAEIVRALVEQAQVPQRPEYFSADVQRNLALMWDKAVGEDGTVSDMSTYVEALLAAFFGPLSTPATKNLDRAATLAGITAEVQALESQAATVHGGERFGGRDGRRKLFDDTVLFLFSKLATGRERGTYTGIVDDAEYDPPSLFKDPPGPTTAGGNPRLSNQLTLGEINGNPALPMSADLAGAFARLFVLLGASEADNASVLRQLYPGQIGEDNKLVPDTVYTVPRPGGPTRRTLSGNNVTLARRAALDLVKVYTNNDDATQQIRATQLLFFSGFSREPATDEPKGYVNLMYVLDRPFFTSPSGELLVIESVAHAGDALAWEAAYAAAVAGQNREQAAAISKAINAPSRESIAVTESIAGTDVAAFLGRAVAAGDDNAVAEALVSAAKAGRADVVPVFAAAKHLLLDDDWDQAQAAASTPAVQEAIAVTRCHDKATTTSSTALLTDFLSNMPEDEGDPLSATAKAGRWVSRTFGSALNKQPVTVILSHHGLGPKIDGFPFGLALQGFHPESNDVLPVDKQLDRNFETVVTDTVTPNYVTLHRVDFSLALAYALYVNGKFLGQFTGIRKLAENQRNRWVVYELHTDPPVALAGAYVAKAKGLTTNVVSKLQAIAKDHRNITAGTAARQLLDNPDVVAALEDKSNPLAYTTIVLPWTSAFAADAAVLALKGKYDTNVVASGQVIKADNFAGSRTTIGLRKGTYRITQRKELPVYVDDEQVGSLGPDVSTLIEFPRARIIVAKGEPVSKASFIANEHIDSDVVATAKPLTEFLAEHTKDGFLVNEMYGPALDNEPVTVLLIGTRDSPAQFSVALRGLYPDVDNVRPRTTSDVLRFKTVATSFWPSRNAEIRRDRSVDGVFTLSEEDQLTRRFSGITKLAQHAQNQWVVYEAELYVPGSPIRPSGQNVTAGAAAVDTASVPFTEVVSTAVRAISEAENDDEAWTAVDGVHLWLTKQDLTAVGRAPRDLVPAESWRASLAELRSALGVMQYDTLDSQAWQHVTALDDRY